MTSQNSGQGGVNFNMTVGGTVGLATYYLWPDQDAYWGWHLMAWLSSAAAVSSLHAGVSDWVRNSRVRKALIESNEPGTEHGSAREASEAELEARGMFNPASGSFIGERFGRAVFAPADAPFMLVEAPPGSGKDINFVVNNILHHSLIGHSVFASDVKLENGPMLIPSLRKAGIETWGINPTKQFLDRCVYDEVGLYQPIVDALYGDDSGRKDAIGITHDLAKLHLPDERGDGSKTYFINGTRRCLSIPPLLYAVIDPARCTPGESFALLNDPAAFVQTLKTIVEKLEPFGGNDQIVEYLKSEAANLLSRSSNNPENFGSFLEWATQALVPYNQAGHLARYGEKPGRNIKDICTRPITAFVMTPHSHMGEFESFTSILNSNLINACKRNPRRQRVHLSCNEFLNYRFANIASDLEIMRGLGVTAEFYIQSFNGLVRKYGAETAASINDYCDVKIYAGLNSYERAKYVSDMLSEETIAGKSYSYPLSPTDVNVSTNRHARRLMTPDEVMAMPRNQAWVFVKGLRPFRVNLINYGEVEPWRSMVDANPLEGPPLKSKTKLELQYPGRKTNGNE